jgi:hypothetical protein
LEKKFTALSLAYWIMDDGSFNKSNGNLILCTDSFSKEDVLRLIHILKTKFHLSCGLINHNKNKNSYRIRINKSSIPLLRMLVKSHIISTMQYKLGNVS